MVLGSVQAVAGNATIRRVKCLACLNTGFGDLNVRFPEAMVSLRRIRAQQDRQATLLRIQYLERCLWVNVSESVRLFRRDVFHLDRLDGGARPDRDRDLSAIRRIGKLGMPLDALVAVVADLSRLRLAVDLQGRLALGLVKYLAE